MSWSLFEVRALTACDQEMSDHGELKISDCDVANCQGSRRTWEQGVGQ